MWITAEQAAAEEAKAFDATLARLEREADRWDYNISHLAKRGKQDTEQYITATDKYGATRDAIKGMRAYYHVNSWNRYYQVPDGKIHKSMGCQSCNHFYISTGYSSTQFIWLTEFSGQPVAEMIKRHGTTMCTICFPDAPLDPAYQEATRKTAAERDAARDAKLAAKAEKDALTPKGDDGEPLKVSGDAPKTERGARNVLASRWWNMIWYSRDGRKHPDHDKWAVDCIRLARSIARLEGAADVDARSTEINAEAQVKAGKKVAADLRKAMKDPRNH